LIAGVATAIALASPACSKTNLGSPQAADAGPPDGFALAMAKSICGALEACCATAHYAYDPESCLVQMQSTFQYQADGAKRANVVFDPNAAAACEKAWHDREAMCTSDSGPPPGLDAGFVDALTLACFGVFKGKFAPGGACDDASECAGAAPGDGTTCEIDMDPDSPTYLQHFCAVYRYHALPGDACMASGGVRPDNPVYNTCESSIGFCFMASPDAGAGSCRAFLPDGAPCVQAQCMPTSFCDTSLITPECRARPRAGEPCPRGFCIESWCDHGRRVVPRRDRMQRRHVRAPPADRRRGRSGQMLLVLVVESIHGVAAVVRLRAVRQRAG
jgi:hypothetical protein